MKKFALAAAALAVTLSAGAAFAENPYVGEPDSMAAQDQAFADLGNRKAIKAENLASAKSQPGVDQTAPAAISNGTQADDADYRSNFGNN